MSSAARTPVILVVDDEELVLTSLRSVFSLETRYRVIEATDPRRALREVEGTPIDVVISDFLMPQMNGIDFLRAVKELQPEAVRILLTGYADKQNAIRAINEVGLYQYLEKPWDNDALLLTVSNAIEGRSLKQQLAEKVQALTRLVSEHNELTARQSLLDRELEMAARVQTSLLPSSFPRLAGFRFANVYRPSELLGGDFYDFAERPDGVTVLVADVIGHGLQAALSTMLLKGIFQQSAASAAGPAALLGEMNGQLHRILPDGKYVATSVLWVAPGRERLVLANAGLPYPFILRSDSRRVDEVVLAGPPLGLFPGTGLSPYDTRELKVAPGDVLLLGSDGLGSVPGADGQYFEDRLLRESLGELAGRDGAEVIRGLMERAVAFSQGRKFPDDVNLLTLTRSA